MVGTMASWKCKNLAKIAQKKPISGRKSQEKANFRIWPKKAEKKPISHFKPEASK
jgi:hypothetical protein